VLPNDDLQSVRRWRPNILLIGPPTAAADLLPLLLSRCRPPVHEMCGGRLAVLPDGGTVVLRGLAELDTGAQRELLRWLEAQDGRVQVVSVAPTPLFPLVADGEFSEALFYRLNVMTMHAGTVD
jgi:hypothetical protein